MAEEKLTFSVILGENILPSCNRTPFLLRRYQYVLIVMFKTFPFFIVLVGRGVPRILPGGMHIFG
jgi:hypothetical protein